MNITNINELKEWIETNLVTKQEALRITEQSPKGFQQSVRTNVIQPFYESKEGKGPSVVRLYLKSDVEKYAEQLEEKRQKRQ